MANYLGTYQDDRNRLYKGSLIRVYSLANGEVTETSAALDLTFLPEIFYDSLTFRDPSTFNCGSLLFAQRQCECLVSDSLAYYITCPFNGGSPNLIPLLRELDSNSLFRVVNLIGERVTSRGAREYFR